jgi:non-ribosomal peptide synthetase component F
MPDPGGGRLGDQVSAQVHSAGGAPLVRVRRDQPIPLSFAQRRLWILDQLLPRRDVYNVPAMFEVRGRLDARWLRESLAGLMHRHEALRTSFRFIDGEPKQVIAPAEAGEVPFFTYDLRRLPDPLRRRGTRRLAARQARHQFDLARGPLWRVGLIRTGDDEHRLLLTLHHIIADGWSLPILVNDLVQLYAAVAAGRPSPLPPLPFQYADFSVWQRAWLTGTRVERQLSYWRDRLAGAPPDLRLPSDRPRPRMASYRGGAVEIVFTAEEYREVVRLSRQLRATPFMVLLAAFMALLHRYTGQEAVTVGTPVANRTHSELEDLVGFFTNTLVLRTELGGDITFAQLVRRVRSTTLEALNHQDLPFERLVDELVPDRGQSFQPLVQVLFALTPMRTNWEVPGLRVRWLSPVRTPTAKFDLSLLLYDEDGRLRGVAEYARDLFDHGTIQRLVGHLRAIVTAVAADPDIPVSRLPPDAEQERQQLV